MIAAQRIVAFRDCGHALRQVTSGHPVSNHHAGSGGVVVARQKRTWRVLNEFGVTAAELQRAESINVCCVTVVGGSAALASPRPFPASLQASTMSSAFEVDEHTDRPATSPVQVIPDVDL